MYNSWNLWAEQNNIYYVWMNHVKNCFGMHTMMKSHEYIYTFLSWEKSAKLYNNSFTEAIIVLNKGIHQVYKFTDSHDLDKHTHTLSNCLNKVKKHILLQIVAFIRNSFIF